MKDKQIARKPESGGIPFLSPVLHLVAMPVIVLLRGRFGYLFLRPKSIILALIWAVALFTVYSYHSPGRWKANIEASVFALMASLAYLWHLFVSMHSQRRGAPHDQFSGRSIFGFLDWDENVVRLWVEPFLALIVSFLLMIIKPDNSLSGFLIFAAGALFFKEGINVWFAIRRVKQQSDATYDAEETMNKVAEERGVSSSRVQNSSTSSRKPQQRRARNRSKSLDEEQGAEVHAAILRMIPPYSLDQAESNFQALVREFHPDEIEQDPEANEKLRALTAARDFFRQYS